MNTTFALFVLVASVVCSLAEPSSYPNDREGLWNPVLDELPDEHTLRVKRATCDLFSFSSKWVTPNHAACAAHCIVRGNKGGRCRNQICYCRK